MPKLYEGSWIFRSVLFVPSHVDKMVAKASTCDADCVVLDLEDAVPTAEKANAREKIREALAQGLFLKRVVFVRINPLETGLTLKDLQTVACKELDGFIYPMARSGDDIKKFDAQLRLMEQHLELPKNHFSIIPLIETAQGVLNVNEIAQASERNVGLLFGCEDYLAEIRGRHSDFNLSLLHPRSMVVLAARASNIEPIDTPYVLDVHDDEGQRDFANQGRDLGMGGMLIMTPRQIPVANEVYTPSPEEVRDAREIVEAARAAKEAGRGIALAGGKFISPPTHKDAALLLKRFDDIQKMEASKSAQ